MKFVNKWIKLEKILSQPRKINMLCFLLYVDIKLQSIEPESLDMEEEIR